MTENNTQENDDFSFEIIRVSNKLKDKALVEGNDFGNDLAAIKRAEKALVGLSENFDDWMLLELNNLSSIWDEIKGQPLTEEAVERLFMVAHDIKGQATTLGYPWISKFSASLCALLEESPDKASVPAQLIEHHIHAARACYHEKKGENIDTLSNSLFKELAGVTRDYVLAEIKRQKTKAA